MVNSVLSSKSLIITGIANQKDAHLSRLALNNSLASSRGYKRISSYTNQIQQFNPIQNFSHMQFRLKLKR